MKALELPINRALKVLEEARDKNYEKLIEWLDMREKIEIPDFYRASEKISAVDALYAAQDFWIYLEGELKKLTDVTRIKECIPMKVAGKIKRSKLASVQADRFLKSAYKIADRSIKEKSEVMANFRRNLNLSRGK